ncbi:DUF4058 family protein [Oscillatoria sp. CS-180]|uniref:DUF4058 family protein n=1 Tax=Oscillatoria sp. CS-180 TaxID=3021720 RepID=UPI00233151EC|nr:DUF4058 family protein [Oscillatoria sp. CS-180]MDB9525109.1 DUF4058 family protein [Oscillatoria sp. CS-180]
MAGCSPIANKRPGRGRQSYETKRVQVLNSATHLVEIDLLRALDPMPMFGDFQSHYRILVSRSHLRPQADLYTFNLSDEIPVFPLPLRPQDEEPLVFLQSLLNEIYDRSGYDLKLDYRPDPVPALAQEEAVWLDELLRNRGLRSSHGQ